MESIKYSLESKEIKYLCSKDKRLAKVISLIGPLEYTIHTDIFAFLVHEIVEQMLSAKAGNAIYARLVSACGGMVTPESISSLSIEQIRSVGMSNKKATCIADLSALVLSDKMVLSKLKDLSDAEVIKTLTSIRGIGLWTAKMCLIFALDRLDVLPVEDKAFLQSYRWLYKTDESSPSAVSKRCKKWSPYSSIAARYMYIVLESGEIRHLESGEINQ